MDGNGSNRGGDRRAQLETAARKLVEELRQRNEPPEQVLLKIKEFLADEGLRSSFPVSDAETAVPEATLYRDLITSSIRYYYEAESDRGSRSADREQDGAE